MTKAAYWVFIALSAFLNILPQKLRYTFSDLTAFLLKYVLRYRKQVVRNNLKKSFPNKPIKEIKRIENSFYHNLADLFVESLQLLTIKGDKLLSQFKIENKELIDSTLASGKSVFVAIGHSGNWEWFAVCLSLLFPGKAGSLYKAQRNKMFDSMIYRMRTRLGNLQMLESKSAYRLLVSQRNSTNIVLIPGDQTPGGNPTDHWTIFMNQETPFFNGLEKMAISLGFEVFFADLQRLGRGFYLARIEELATDVREMQPGVITEAYARRLEQALLSRPDNWLWSHRRWKHKRNKSAQ